MNQRWIKAVVACGMAIGIAAGCQRNERSVVHTKKSTNEYPRRTDDPTQPEESEYHMTSPGQMVVE